MARNEDGLRVVTPEPVDEEQRPLLDPEHPEEGHGTIERPHGADIPIAEEPSTWRLLTIVGSMWLGSFFAALDSTIVATLASPISTSFNSFTLLSWLASGYLIANAAIQPLSGRLSDIYGRRAGFIFACTFFAAGTLVCGLAKSAPVIIAGRVIAGSGGGCLNTISTFIASDLIPLRKRGLWQGFANIVYGMGMGLGGVFGGFMNDRLNWRWAFYIQVPFIVLAGIMGAIFVDIPVKESDKSKIKRVDFLGAILLSTSLVLLLLALNSGGNTVPWSHPLVTVSLPLSAVALAAFAYVETRVSEPVIPVKLLLRRTVAAACLTNWFMTMSVFALLYYAPIYFQVVFSLTATQVGTRIIPVSVGTSVGSLGAGLIMRTTGKYWWLNVGVQTLSIVSATLITATFNRDLPVWPPFIYLFLNGTAYGATLTVTLLGLLAAVGHEHQAVITSASYAFRSTGSTIGITIASSVFQNVLKDRLWERFGDLPNAAHWISKMRDDVDQIRHLPEQWRDGAVDVYVEALRAVWVLIMGLACLGGLVSLCMKEHVLHKTLARK